MRRHFNVTGSCNPKLHYMVDLSKKFAFVRRLVDQGDYFTINRPRQYGKTTMLFELLRGLSDEYLVLPLSFEGVGDLMFEDEHRFSAGFVNQVVQALSFDQPELAETVRQLGKDVIDSDSLSAFISSFVRDAGRDVILLVDEVDKSSNSQSFLSFLGMLRQKYLLRAQGRAYTFKSVVLTGVHDVKSLKLKVREGIETKLNSPWNIAADFNVDMSFSPAEIKTLLADYATETGVQMDMDAIAARLHYCTSGHPFLVSKLCKILDEEAAAESSGFDAAQWTVADIDWAFRWLVRDEYTTTNFDDLVKNLENSPDLYELVYLVNFGVRTEKLSLSRKDPIVEMALQYGIFGYHDRRLRIHNRVYEQILADYFHSRQFTKGRGYSFNGYLDAPFVSPDERLLLGNVLERFQAFMREHYSDRDADFLEREGRLIFMSFLKPIINGHGFMWKEPVVGDERRMDLVVTFGKDQKEVVELKIWRGQAYHECGLAQLSDYLDTQGLKTGYLLIFDFRTSKEWKAEEIFVSDKTVAAVWV